MGGGLSDRPAPPYPAETRAKGWRFELDYEKIDQSDTWSLASEVPLARAGLLAVWLMAWTQEPCGTLPNDESVIRARCQIPAPVWAKVRHILMRGWWLASDGRLYHDTLTARVMEMVEYRRKTAKRVADFKAAQREQRAANALPTGEQPAKNDTGTGTNLKDKKKEKAPAAPSPSVSDLVAAGFDEQTAAEFIAAKAARKAPLTARAWADHLREAAKAGWTPLAAADKVLAKSWKGFEAKYVANETPNGAQPMTFRERDAANAAARVAEMTGGLVSAKPTPITRRNDALQEVFDAPRLLG